MKSAIPQIAKRYTQVIKVTPVLALLMLCSCNVSDETSSGLESDVDTQDNTNITEVNESNSYAVDSSKFDLGTSGSVSEVACTLSNGQASTCYSVTISGFPSDRTELGPFCPQTTSTTAVDAGKWFDDGVLYDLTGEFITNLGLFYGDSTWNLYDKTTGEVNITDTQVACEAAARPNIDAQYNNFCVQCEISYYSGSTGEGISSTYLIPTIPVPRTSAGSVGRGNVGVAFNGVTLDAAAPTEAILGAYTIAAFDDCVGHVNPFAGYHYHGANHGEGTCPAIAFEADGHGGAFGYAMDGYAIYSMLDENNEEATDLDSCRGHTDDVCGYHYHSAGAGENLFIGCFSGEVAQ
ncbi:YHYH protein [Colwellia sp. E2M01]|uniref:YHYH protein n=1 Tax=Colwellia sp. E2M01 TaxID=2841561 RepID=UPI001C0A0909|nr:YHYH protein [Colwellia sp. E2M01]MBU2869655.1 YHYH protein [Colwellia sp. E2M01]